MGRAIIVVCAALMSSACVSLLGGTGYPVFHEPSSPVGQGAAYEMEELTFDRAIVDGQPEKTFLASADYADDYVQLKTEAATKYLENLTARVPSTPSAPWVVKAAVLKVRTDATTTLAGQPKNGITVEISVTERATGKVVERFVYEGAGGRTGMRYALSAVVIGRATATILETGKFPE
jgi:hypothetical protein